jgi:hypothetical protein
MRLPFTKMHGAGNDFVVLDFTARPFNLNSQQLKALANRQLGIGADQILVVEKPRQADVDFRYRIFNADGGEVEQCGNGARCFVKFVRSRKLTDKREIRVETLGGTIVPRLEADGEVSVDMGPPRIESLSEVLEVGNDKVDVAILSMGNPHAVQLVAEGAGEDAGSAARAPSALSRPGQRRLHAGVPPQRDIFTRLGARRGRDVVVRHRRLRGGGGRDLEKAARFAGAGADARRSVDHLLGGRRQCGVDEGPRRVCVRRNDRDLEQQQ